jgi:poly-beta-1,6-N-acetyl-D-glucosamine synthase
MLRRHPQLSAMSKLSYVVVTPARNEAEYIGLTLDSMVAQTVPPLRWVIVSDGSTDGTDEVVGRYAAIYPWITLIHVGDRKERHFAGKVHSFNQGYECLRGLEYDVIASLDADISFDPHYFEFLLEKLSDQPEIGVVGTPFQEASGELYDYRFVSIEHVSGACQVFRRKCFEAIGGYRPIKNGSIDHVAVISARMKGWKTRTYRDKVCVHHRPIGTAQTTVVRARFAYGMKDYAIGNSPLWQVFRSAYQMTKPPYLVGGAALACGYFWAMLRGADRCVSPDLVAFHRREQHLRLTQRLFNSDASSASVV